MDTSLAAGANYLKLRPGLPRLLQLLNGHEFHELTTAVIYLKEFELGLDICSRLIGFIEKHSQLNASDPTQRKTLVALWRWTLFFLDRADKWDDYVKTAEAVGRREDLVETDCERWINESTYRHYKELLRRGGASRPLRAYQEEMVSEAERAEERRTLPDGSWAARIPPRTRHMLDNWAARDRLRIILKKISRKVAGKSVRHLRHRQVFEMTDEEYMRRQQWLRMWRLYCRNARQEPATKNAI